MRQEQAGVAPFVIQTVQDAVVERLRHLILSRQLQPGQRLVQIELAQQLGVSRTPIRDALNRLAHEGLVTLSTYKGASVARFSASDLEEVYAIRTALESYATYLAAQRITAYKLEQLEGLVQDMSGAFRAGDFECLLEVHYQFHITIYEMAEKSRLLGLIRQYLDLSNVYQRMALSMGRGAQDPVVEHREIVTTLRQRDPEVTGSLIRAHLGLTASELLELFQNQQ